MRVIGYLRVSTHGQEYGIEAQRSAISAEGARRDWQVEWVEDAGRSGKDIDRPGITYALEQLKNGAADALAVSKLDRLSRSLGDFAHMLETANKQGWGVVAIDLGIDTTTPTGELVANIMAAVSRWERRMIGQRTKEGLAEAKRRGVKVGRPRSVSPEVTERIVAMRHEGLSYGAIAKALNEDCVPLPAGGVKWHASSVQNSLCTTAIKTANLIESEQLPKRGRHHGHTRKL